MLSPFPGMDPYLEDLYVWPDFHHAIAIEISSVLNRDLPTPYYAITGRRIEFIDPIKQLFIEVRDSKRGHKLVTLIEILSPSNKRPGPDRDAYRAKQSEVLGSDASLIEIDLLRSGEHILPDLNLSALVAQLDPPADYLVMVSRAWKRGGGTVGYEVFPCVLREWLPCIPVPLKEGEPEVPLDLQYVMNRAYESGPYLRGAVDYASAPDPPLSPHDLEWAAERLRDWTLETSASGEGIPTSIS